MIETRNPLIRKLIARLADEDPVARRNAIGTLRLHGDRALEAVPALQRLLSDQDPGVRREARRVLDLLRTVAA